MTDETIFAIALEKADPAERATYLDSACAGDPQRRVRVEGLLAALARANRLLEGPADRPAPGPTWDSEMAAEHREGTEGPIDFLEPPLRSDSLGRLGHYEILQVVGRGGFGIVFRAFDDVLQRVVAIKLLSPQMAATSPARKRFVREARGYAAIRHENVVQVHAIEAEPLPYLVMEFIPGETLENLINRTGPLDAADVVRIGVQLARGLAAAHAIGLVHRDIKPANVLIENGPDRRVKLTDFGLARAADDASLTQSGMVAGTPMYMAPEQAHGDALDHRADLFSLGSVLYTLCTGRPPFRAETSLAVLRRVVEDDPRPIRDVIPEIPSGLCEIIAKLHAKNPDVRFQSAAELAERLSNCLTRPPIAPTAVLRPVAPTAGAKETASAVPDARPVVGRWFALAAGALLLVVGTVVVYESMAKKAGGARPQAEPVAAAVAVGDLLASPDWTWSPPENLGPGVNGAGRDLAPTLTADELMIVFARDQKLWTSRRASIGEPFGPAEPLPDAISIDGRESPSISGDGLVLVFPAVRDGTAYESVWMSTRATRAEPFGEPVRLPEPVNRPSGWATAPVLSADGLTLLVTGPRPSGPGKGDVTMYTRATRADAFVNETLLPAPVSSAAFDVPCWISDDRRVVVCTKMEHRPFETRFHTRASADTPFGPAQALGALPEGHEIGRPWLSPDGARLYFHSRELTGGAGDLDIWMVRRVPKNK